MRSPKTRQTIILKHLIIVLAITAMVDASLAQNSPRDYLDAHNTARAQVGVKPLTWDNIVAAHAQNWSDARIEDCDLVLSGGPYGENLAKGTDINGTGAVGLWISERNYYNYNSNECSGGGDICGHYTQVVWGNTKRLGCARVGCNNGWWFVTCNYDPPGNIVGQRPYPETPSFTQSPASQPPSSTNDPALEPPSFIHDPASEPSNFTHGSKNNVERIRLIVGLSIGGVCALVGGLVVVLFACWRKRKREKEVNDRFNEEMDNEFKTGMGPKRFSNHELARATNNFSEDGKLGQGGFGGVYKGFLRELSSYVAVKRVSKSSKQGIKEYASEVRIISRLRHKNMVQLIGWCHEKKELLLVYEFMENGSLDSHLFKQKSLLNWEIRYKIAQGLASALLYLHEEWEQCVLHRDIKSSNIMLDSNFNAKLGDFGLAKLVDHEKGSQTTVLAGTLGYMAPECCVTGKATKETDVFSYGVVALEIACGRKPIDYKAEPNQIRLVEWVWELYGTGNLLEAADPRLQFNFAEQEMEHLMIVGLWCAHPDEKERPSIKKAIQVLNFEAPLPTLPPSMPVPTYSAPPISLLSSAYGKEFSANSEIQLSGGR